MLFVGHLMAMTPEQMQAWSLQRELDERNRPLTDEEIDAVLPEGYKVIACRFCYLIVINYLFYSDTSSSLSPGNFMVMFEICQLHIFVEESNACTLLVYLAGRLVSPPHVTTLCFQLTFC